MKHLEFIEAFRQLSYADKERTISELGAEFESQRVQTTLPEQVGGIVECGKEAEMALKGRLAADTVLITDENRAYNAVKRKNQSIIQGCNQISS